MFRQAAQPASRDRQAISRLSGCRRALVGLVWAIGAAGILPASASDKPFTASASRLTPNPNFKDTILGARGISYQDPEFWEPTRQVVWQDEDQSGEVWIASLDPNTGAMIPRDGKGVSAGPSKRLVSLDYPGAFNGPEWGISAGEGLCVYFTRVDAAGINQVARYSLATRRTTFVTTGGQTHRSGALPSNDPTATAAGVMTFNFGQYATWQPTWRLETQPTIDVFVPNAMRGTSGPRWVPGRMLICTNQFDRNRICQLALYDVMSRTTQVVTDGGTVHRTEGVCFWPDEPQFRGRLGAWCLEGPELAMYVEGNGPFWTKVKSVPALEVSGRTIRPFSLEPFSFNGKSYCIFAGSRQSMLPWLAENDIYLAGFDLDEAMALTNPLDGQKSLDPEAVVMGGKAFVYYTEVRTLVPNRLHVLTDFIPVTID